MDFECFCGILGTGTFVLDTVWLFPWVSRKSQGKRTTQRTKKKFMAWRTSPLFWRIYESTQIVKLLKKDQFIAHRLKGEFLTYSKLLFYIFCRVHFSFKNGSPGTRDSRNWQSNWSRSSNHEFPSSPFALCFFFQVLFSLACGINAPVLWRLMIPQFS